MERIINLSTDPYHNYLKLLKPLTNPGAIVYLLVTECPQPKIETDSTGHIISVEPRGCSPVYIGQQLEGKEILEINLALGCGYLIRMTK